MYFSYCVQLEKNIKMISLLYVYDEKVLSVGSFFTAYTVFYLYSLQVSVRSCNIQLADL